MSTDPFAPVAGLGEPRKFALVDRCLPTASLLDAGGMWGVHGAYALHAARAGVPRVVVADTIETPEFRECRERVPGVEYYPADLNDLGRMSSLPKVETSLCFEVIFHQAMPMLTLYGLTLCTTKRILLALSVLPEERAGTNGAIFLPGLPPELQDELHPDPSHPTAQVFSERPADARTNPEWHWGLTSSLVTSWMTYLGWSRDSEGREPFCGIWEWWWGEFRPDPDARFPGGRRAS